MNDGPSRRTLLRRVATAVFLLPAASVARAGDAPPPQQAEFASWPADPRVRFEPGADAYAQAVAAVLPAAVARVETAQGRRFREPIHVAVYATALAYARDNGMGADVVRGVTFLGGIMLSPRLWSRAGGASDALVPILTHELSHLHLQGHRGLLAYAHLPTWFLEGLAVVVSGGGGTERVSPAAARAEIAADRTIRITDATSLFGHGFDTPLAPFTGEGDVQYRFHMAYRQAAVFIEHVRTQNPAGFARLLDRLLDGDDFATSFRESLGMSSTAAWRAFVATVKGQRAGG